MITDEQVYEILQEFRQGEVLSVHDGIMLGRYLIRSTYGIYTITKKLNKLLENEKRIDKLTYIDQGIFLSQMETIREMLTELNTKLYKIQEQLTSLSGENKKESPQKEETQEKSCATCGHFDIICKKDWCGDNYKGWQPKDNQAKFCVESFNTPSGKKDNQDENCRNCSIDKYCDGYCSGFQPKDNQESR